MPEQTSESHPAFAMIGAYRTSISPPGASLFDSEIRHQHTVVLRLERAVRQRDLNRDWIYGRDRIVEVEMSEAQWASFVSSMNTSGVPCTLRWLDGEKIEPVEYAPRLEQSIDETRSAADRAFGQIVEALRIYEETPAVPKRAKDEALQTLRAAVSNATPNVVFAAKSLGEHTENVVQKARADVEAMVADHASRLGLDAGDSVVTLALPAPQTEEDA